MTATVTPLLTATQQRVLTAIRGYFTQHGYPPALRDIAAETGLSLSAVSHQVHRLTEKGWIRRAPGRPRALVVLDPADGTGS